MTRIIFESGHTLMDLAQQLGRDYAYIYYLYRQGRSEQDIIDWTNRDTVAKICRRKGLSTSMVYQRLYKGMSLEDAVNTPPKPRSRRNITSAKYIYKGTPIRRLIPDCSAYQRITSYIRQGRATIEELMEEYLNENDHK